MASVPITSWQIDGEKLETVTNFIFLGSKITVDGESSHEIKRCLLLGRKAMTNLDNVLKSRYQFSKKKPVQSKLIFPVVMYGCESWRLSTEELMLSNLWFWRRLLRAPWAARRSSQLILKEINPEFCLLKNIYLFIYLFLAALGIGFCSQDFTSCSDGDYSLIVVHRLLIEVVSLFVENRLQGARAQQLWHIGFVAMWHVESSWTRDQTCVPCIAKKILNHWTTREASTLNFYWKDCCQKVKL